MCCESRGNLAYSCTGSRLQMHFDDGMIKSFECSVERFQDFRWPTEHHSRSISLRLHSLMMTMQKNGAAYRTRLEPGYTALLG